MEWRTRHMKLQTISKRLVTAELLCTDVLYLIFKNLKIEDLYNVTEVCWSWRDVAKRIIIARSVPKIGIWNIKPVYDDVEDWPTKLNMKKIIGNNEELLSAKPVINIIFASGVYVFPESRYWLYPKVSTFHTLAYENKKYRSFYVRNRNKLYNVAGIMIDDKEIDPRVNQAVSLSLASIPISGVSVHYENYEKLFSEDMRGKSICLINFRIRNNRYDKPMIDMLRDLKSRHDCNRFSLWGGDVSVNSPTMKFFKGFDAERYNHWTALIIARSSLQCWSFNISLQAGLDAERKFIDMKKKIRLRSKSIALAMGPTNRHRNDTLSSVGKWDELAAFKRIFPEISLTTIFMDRRPFHDQNKSLSFFSYDSTNDDRNQTLVHYNCFAFLILSWDLE